MEEKKNTPFEHFLLEIGIFVVGMVALFGGIFLFSVIVGTLFG